MNRIGKFARNNSPPLKLYLNLTTLFRQGSMKKRSWREAPIYLRLNKMFYETRFGLQCRRINDLAHYRSYEAFMSILAYTERYHVRRKISLLLCSLGSFWFAHFVTTRSNNLYVHGWNQGWS